MQGNVTMVGVVGRGWQSRLGKRKKRVDDWLGDDGDVLQVW